MEKQTTAQRLKQIMTAKKLRQADILRMAEPYCKKYNVKLNKSDLSQFVNGKNVPGQWKLTVLGLALNVSEAWLMGYDVPVERSTEKKTKGSIPGGFEPIPAYHMVPVIGDIACGTPILAKENIDDYKPCPDFVHSDFCLRCKGDSMINARINDGDIVFIRKQPQVENGEIAAVEILDGEDYDECCEATLKRFYRKGNKVILSPENPKYSPLIFVGEEINNIKIVGKAVYFISDVE